MLYYMLSLCSTIVLHILFYHITSYRIMPYVTYSLMKWILCL